MSLRVWGIIFVVKYRFIKHGVFSDENLFGFKITENIFFNTIFMTQENAFSSSRVKFGSVMFRRGGIQ